MQYIFVMSYLKVLFGFKIAWICQLLPSWLMLRLQLLHCNLIGDAICNAL